MRQALWTLPGVALFATGCSVAGSWKTVQVHPPGVRFPVDALTLDRDNKYTATWTQNGRTRTGTGTYRWRWSKLEVSQPGRAPRVYGARLRLDGKLELTYEVGGAGVTAILEKTGP